MKKLLPFGLALLIIFVASYLIRIPHFSSRYYWFDGDEAVIGIMAKDFLSSGKLPFFFYGQHYGFASVEVLSASFFIALFGSTVLSLKLAGLLIHSLALTFIYFVLKKRQVRGIWLLVLMLLLICFPSFYLWGAQMRTTSLLLAAIILYVIETGPISTKRLNIVILLSFFLAQAQMMAFFFCGAFILNWLWKSPKRWMNIALFSSLFTAIYLLFHFFVQKGESVYFFKFQFGANQWETLVRQFDGFWPGFNNFHYFSAPLEAPPWWQVGSMIAFFLFAGLIFSTFFRNKEKRPLLLFFTLSTLAYLFLLSIFTELGPRYWINFHLGLLLLLVMNVDGDALNRSRIQRWLLPATALAMFIGIFSGGDMKLHTADPANSEAAAFEELHTSVVREKNKALFTTDVMLQWQWNYFYGNEIPCSSFYREERTNTFTDPVFVCYDSTPDRVGIVGINGHFLGMDFVPEFNPLKQVVGGKYYHVPATHEAFVDKVNEVILY